MLGQLAARPDKAPPTGDAALYSRAEQLLEGLRRASQVLADRTAWENGYEAAFTSFRRGCISGAASDVLEASMYSEQQMEVAWLFIFEVRRRHQTRRRQTGECARSLGASGQWSKVLCHSTRVREALLGLAPELQRELLEASGASQLLPELGHSTELEAKASAVAEADSGRAALPGFDGSAPGRDAWPAARWPAAEAVGSWPPAARGSDHRGGSDALATAPWPAATEQLVPMSTLPFRSQPGARAAGGPSPIPWTCGSADASLRLGGTVAGPPDHSAQDGRTRIADKVCREVSVVPAQTWEPDGWQQVREEVAQTGRKAAQAVKATNDAHGITDQVGKGASVVVCKASAVIGRAPSAAVAPGAVQAQNWPSTCAGSCDSLEQRNPFRPSLRSQGGYQAVARAPNPFRASPHNPFSERAPDATGAGTASARRTHNPPSIRASRPCLLGAGNPFGEKLGPAPVEGFEGRVPLQQCGGA
mmetsp:Transcript_45265/g.144221  ORF Transcript_45265/g.144221 Transcript_45265/m.144221 type:complete len:476 (-) Transcript_45265:195-1622(-)